MGRSPGWAMPPWPPPTQRSSKFPTILRRADVLTLKTYQQNALSALRDFLRAARGKPLAEAFADALAAQGRHVDATRPEAYHAIFGDAPCVCLRVPTGGGKTLLAAHAVAIAGECTLDSDAPVALWL